MRSKGLKAAVLGYGTIGSGVVEILEKNSALIERQAGRKVEVKYVLDLREFPGDPVNKYLVHDFDVIANDPEVDVVIETMGGTGAAYTFVKASLLAGKHAVTSNKALVAKYGCELLEIAREKKINFLFEASVGGGIPIIRSMFSALRGTNIKSVTGILNGTTNFMLTKMLKENRDYADVLAEAQALGFAERDPSADVEGFDACRKIAILASVATGRFVDFEDISTRGITDVTKEDMEAAAGLGLSLKLVARYEAMGEKAGAFVCPAALTSQNPLANVNGVVNGVLVDGEESEELLFTGPGAGKLPTASAVVADVVEAVIYSDRTVYGGWTDEKLQVEDISGIRRQYLITGTGAGAYVTEPMTRAEAEAKAAGGRVYPVL